MKKIKLFFGVALSVAVLLMLALMLQAEQTSEMNTPWDLQEKCPTKVVVNGAEVPVGEEGVAKWTAFISNLNKTAPNIVLDTSSWTRPEGVDAPSCTMEITKLPGTPLEGVDWRIGFSLPNAAIVRGKTVKVSMKVKADTPIKFGAAAYYSNDGKLVPYFALTDLNEDWRELTWDHKVGDDADVFEVWLRLTIHGTISTTGTVYLSDVRLVAN
ncbi:hypothetical protein [Magnetovibrio sp.]|uniref:hypothetical protein n=1 Tax=Magnetovibrio sp. TaxID=2024836 RepID=UPI002F958178